ncbi:MAG: hypothetical protein QXU18_09865 [Thermoplasmatales archaeon]
MIAWNTILDFVLTFVVGLLFGLAIKKGAMAFLLAIIGFLIAGYVGITFIPKVSITYEINRFFALAAAYLKDFQIGTLAVSLTVVLFLIGLAIGLWKG